jgi:hypothetical protein
MLWAPPTSICSDMTAISFPLLPVTYTTAIPEPASVALLGSGLACLLALRRRPRDRELRHR